MRGLACTLAAMSIVAGCALPELSKREDSVATTAPSSSGPDSIPSGGGNGASTGDGGSGAGANGASTCDGGSQGLGGGALCPGGNGAAGGGGGEGGTREPIKVSVPIAQDSDDATWIYGTDERLQYEPGQPHLEVGADDQNARMGLRFTLSIPPGSTIKGATLRLHRILGDEDDNHTILIQVYDTTTLEPFDDAHYHFPEEHAAEGLWSIGVVSLIGPRNADIDTPDLKELVQHVIDKPEWYGNGVVGFLISPQFMFAWAEYGDSSAGTGAATLSFEYTPP